MAEVTVRDAYVNDVAGIAPLVGQLGYPSSADQVRRRLERLLGIRNIRVMVADLEGVVVGLSVTGISYRIEHDQPVCSLRFNVTFSSMG